MTLAAGADPLEALELLEAGRNVLAASFQNRRADVSSLRLKNPHLAESYASLRQELNSSARQYAFGRDTKISSHSDRNAVQLSSSERMFEQVITEIRTEHGFESFLLTPDKSEICDAAKRGPIVVINVSMRCDAILITQDDIRSLELKNLYSDDVLEKIDEYRMRPYEVLEWLWDCFARPILDALGFTQPPTGNRWPHVWWIVTGCLSELPIHAAGYHRYGNTQSVIDRVMSSYSPSLRAIIDGRSVDLLAATTTKQALLIAMEKTPDYSVKLDFADEELETVRDVCKSMSMGVVEPQRCRNNVLSHIPDCKIFHFAGHGSVHETNPLESHFALEDWKSDPRTVLDLLRLDLHKSSPFLVYLSARGSSQVKNPGVSDEQVHLVSACQMAGFRHVIGTLWEVNDEVCVAVAKTVYEEIKEGGFDDDVVCYGLHKAIHELRNQGLSQSSILRLKTQTNEEVEVASSNDHESDMERDADEDEDLRREDKQQEEKYENDDDDDGNEYDYEDIDTDSDPEAHRLMRDIMSCDSHKGDESFLRWVPYVHCGV